jgi:hypothetical protein
MMGERERGVAVKSYDVVPPFLGRLWGDLLAGNNSLGISKARLTSAGRDGRRVARRYAGLVVELGGG